MQGSKKYSRQQKGPKVLSSVPHYGIAFPCLLCMALCGLVWSCYGLIWHFMVVSWYFMVFCGKISIRLDLYHLFLRSWIQIYLVLFFIMLENSAEFLRYRLVDKIKLNSWDHVKFPHTAFMMIFGKERKVLNLRLQLICNRL